MSEGGNGVIDQKITRRDFIKRALGFGAKVAVGGATTAVLAACNNSEPNPQVDTGAQVVDGVKNTITDVRKKTGDAVATVTSPQADKNRKDNINRASKNVTGSTLGENVRSAKDQAGGFLKDRVNEAEEAAQNAIDAAEKGAKTIGTGADAPVQLVDPKTFSPSSR